MDSVCRGKFVIANAMATARPSSATATSNMDGIMDGLAAESKVLLILAGGTICMQSSPHGLVPTSGLLQTCLSGHSAFDDGSHPAVDTIVDEDLVRRPGDASLRLPAVNGTRVHYTAFEFKTLIDSSAADAQYWNRIADCIIHNYHAFDGFVVMHGTDTLAYAASALSFVLHPLGKPVVLTGSQVSIFDEPSDAWDNILGSLVIAGRRLADEVCIFFHRTLFRGNRAVKIHASEYAAFGTPNLDPLAVMDETTKQIVRSGTATPTTNGTTASPSSVPPLDALVPMNSEDVVVLRVYPGLQPAVIAAVLATPGLRGVIIETFGAGNMPPGHNDRILQALAAAVKRGVVIVNVSQCLNGTVSPIYAPARALEKLGVVYGHDMTTEAAYTKLLYLLSRPGLTTDEVTRLMATDLRGELSARRPGIDRPHDELEQGRERRNSLIVRTLGWSSYTPTVPGVDKHPNE